MKLAFVFPGQASQYVGMGQDIANNFNSAKEIFQEIDDALGEKLSDLMFNGAIEDLSRTINTQPALMASSLAVINILRKEFDLNLEKKIILTAGHSLGEYSAYAAFGSLNISDCAKLLRLRGKAMSESATGSMFALLGANLEQAKNIASDAAAGEICDIANDNCPGQIVLSGNNNAIDRAIKLAQEQGLKAIKLQVSNAFHSGLMEPAKLIMRDALGETNIKMPSINLISNVEVDVLNNIESIKNSLTNQVTGMVRWRETIEYMLKCDVTHIIEIGSGKVLSGLNKRISKEIISMSVESVSDIENLMKLIG